MWLIRNWPDRIIDGIDAYFEGRWTKWLIPLVLGMIIGFLMHQ